MTTPTRYTPADYAMEADRDGAYVKYADYAELLKECHDMRRALEHARDFAEAMGSRFSSEDDREYCAQAFGIFDAALQENR